MNSTGKWSTTPVRVVTDTGSPHDVLVGIDSAILIDATSGAVTLTLGSAAGWIYPDGSSYELKVTAQNATSTVTLDGGTDDIIDDAGANATTLTLALSESVIISSDGTDFYVVVSGGALA